MDIVVATKGTIYLASDAMNTAGAGIHISASGTEEGYFVVDYDNAVAAPNRRGDPISEYNEHTHINVKETDVGRRTALWGATCFPGFELRLAVDNTSAKVGLTRLICIADANEEKLLEEMDAFLRKQLCTLVVVQVPGIHQAADARSRGQPSSPLLMSRSKKYLEEARTDEWFRSLRKQQRRT